MLPHNSTCECGTIDSERVWVSCLWCTEPHHGGRPRGQTRWCRCQCHWLTTLPEAVGRDATGICWGCMAEFCSGAYSDVYRLDRIYWLLDKTNTVMRRHVDRATEYGTTVEVHRPTHTWGDEDPGRPNKASEKGLGTLQYFSGVEESHCGCSHVGSMPCLGQNTDMFANG